MQNSRCSTTCSPLLETLTASRVTRALKGLGTPEQTVAVTWGQCSALHRPWEGADAQLQGQKEPWLRQSGNESPSQPWCMWLVLPLSQLYFTTCSLWRSHRCAVCSTAKHSGKPFSASPPLSKGQGIGFKTMSFQSCNKYYVVWIWCWTFLIYSVPSTS